MKKPTLLVLAAGMGSRYGGLKQMEGFGPDGATLLDYSSHDALGCGFGRLVFVIRRDFAAAFEAAVAAKWRTLCDVELVFQDPSDLPEPWKTPEGRTKPWGTVHALLAARKAIQEPFLMINADDFYGRDSFEVMHAFLAREARPKHYAMAGYTLATTLSPNGGVTRAVCKLGAQGELLDLEELKDVRRLESGTVQSGARILGPDARVSMNCFGFGPDVFPILSEYFLRFLETHPGSMDSECLIPDVVGDLVRGGRARVDVLPTKATWFGVTYPADRPRVQAEIKKLHDLGLYPDSLWK
ncbi:MAG TPA: nucleotidyltransferase [bacterium]|jgi:hypothetical protein|nr:nucleotidyltransferase [bacterium]